MLPYFKKSEDNSRGADAFHAIGGPQKVSDLRLRRPIAEHFIQAATEIGIPLNKDYNGSQQEGVSYFQQTAYNGFRWSTAKSFLRPARGRANLSVVTRAQVTSLVFDGKRVTGVNYRRGHARNTASASAEVILSAGAINSPQILQNSGVGDPAWLQQAGIDTRHALPGVGKNLQDHLQIRLVFKTNKHTLNDELNNPLKRMMVGMQYMLTRTGPLTLAASQVVRSSRVPAKTSSVPTFSSTCSRFRPTSPATACTRFRHLRRRYANCVLSAAAKSWSNPAIRWPTRKFTRTIYPTSATVW